MTVAELIELLDDFADDAQIRFDGGSRMWDVANVSKGDDGSCIIEIV
jgi:hypothetical protein